MDAEEMLSSATRLKHQATVRLDRCIICQKPSTKNKALHSGEIGLKRIREIADHNDDDIKRRLVSLGTDVKFKYHTYTCYRNYKNTITPGVHADPEETIGSTDQDASTSSQRPLRSISTPRQQPVGATTLNSNDISCFLCDSDRVTNKSTKKRVREKHRICERSRAELLLRVMQVKHDNIYRKCSDITTAEGVFAADLYCHNLCFKRYTKSVPDPSSSSSSSSVSSKSDAQRQLQALNNVFTILKPYFQEGYSFTINEVKGMMYSNDETLTCIWNKHVKKLILEHYSNSLKVCKNVRMNESDIVFSSHITVSDIAKHMKHQNVLQHAGTILREAFKKVDFGLGDRFCDGAELKNSWENTRMPEPLLDFFSSLFNIDKSKLLTIEMLDLTEDENNDDDEDVEEVEDEDEDDEEVDSNVQNEHKRLNCLFQIMYNNIFHGRKRTPLTVSFGQYQYGKSRSKEILTAANHLGVSISYDSVRRMRKQLAQYAVKQSGVDGVPIPDTFAKESFTFAALDNADFKDTSSLSGTKSDHVTMQVIYQEARVSPVSKPTVSSMHLGDRSETLPEMLPCQKVPFKPKPASKPQLPPSFKITDVNAESTLDTQGALQHADIREAALSLIRCGYPTDNSSACLPTWGGSHALVTTATVPLSRVGFLPVIPSPVTSYATVYKALQNFQKVRHQLNPTQTAIPVVCDEGVYHIVMDILMHEPDAFNDVHAVMGMFHFTKVILRCAGRYLRGSGIEDALIEQDIFGKLTLKTVMEGTHYARSFTGMIMISDMINGLIWEAFWSNREGNGYYLTEDLKASIKDVQQQLIDKQCCPEMFDKLCKDMSGIFAEFDVFVDECCAKSELCAYLMVFQKEYASLIKHAVSSDREGCFDLHVGIVREALPIFAEHDCINYLRCGTFYLEATRSLETKHQGVFRHLQTGFFVVKDKPNGTFNAVSGDMKLEQTAQRSSKSHGGIVGQTRSIAYMTEWQLVFHEILEISNMFRDRIEDNTMNHLETHVHHELRGSTGRQLHMHVNNLIDFIKDKGNPFVVKAPGITPLHNMVTKQMVSDVTTARLLQVKANGEHYLTVFRHERFVARTKKISFLIERKSLPTMHPVKQSTDQSSAKSKAYKGKYTAAAQRDIDIAKERGMPLKDIYGFDLLPSSVIFEGDFPTKPDKSALVSELQNMLTPEDMKYTGGEASVILDFMSKIRSFPDARESSDGRQSSATFGDLIKRALNSGSVCTRTNLHVVFDSYNEYSIKSAERMRRGDQEAALHLANIGASDLVPKQLDKFWNSPNNKMLLQELTRTVAIDSITAIDVILSGCETNGDLLKATCSSFDHQGQRTMLEINTLSQAVEEADDRIILHCQHEVDAGQGQIMVVSNDTDTLVRLLFFIHKWIQQGLRELWLEFGTGERRRHIPIHTLYEKLGREKSRALLKAYVLTGDDSLSKIGTKHAAFVTKPEEYLADFAERRELSKEESIQAETFLVKVWASAKSITKARSFDDLRLEQYLGSKAAKTFESLPPSSSVIHGHIRRAFFVVRRVMFLLDDSHEDLDPTDFGWTVDMNNNLLPDKCLKPLPSHITVLCKCKGKCVSRACPCKQKEVRCVLFCHSASVCGNK